MHWEQSVGRWCHGLCWVWTWAAAVHTSGVRCGCFYLHGWVASVLRSLIIWSSWLWIWSFLWKGLGEKAWSAAADCRELAESWGHRLNRYVHCLMGSWYDGSIERWDIAGRSRSLGTFPWCLFLVPGPFLFFSAFWSPQNKNTSVDVSVVMFLSFPGS